MKAPLIGEQSGPSETDMNEQIQKAVTDAIKESNDKTVEIKPANESKGMGTFARLSLIVGAFAAGYWLRKSQKPTEKLQSAASETADRTKEMTHQAAQTIEKGGETVSERVEEGSEKAGQQVQQKAESAAETTEQVGEKAAEKAEEKSSGSSGGSSGS